MKKQITIGAGDAATIAKEFIDSRMDGFFGAIRDAVPDYWGRRVIERNAGHTQLEEFDSYDFSSRESAAVLQSDGKYRLPLFFPFFLP